MTSAYFSVIFMGILISGKSTSTTMLCWLKLSCSLFDYELRSRFLSYSWRVSLTRTLNLASLRMICSLIVILAVKMDELFFSLNMCASGANYLSNRLFAAFNCPISGFSYFKSAKNWQRWLVSSTLFSKKSQISEATPYRRTLDALSIFSISDLI